MTTATLGGKPLLGTSPVRWTLREGVQPVIETFDMAPADALAVASSGGPVELVIEPGASMPPKPTPLRVRNLWVLNIAPGDNQYVSRVTVADRRWFWSYAHVLRRYNMRRNVGVKRILASDQAAVPFDRAPEVAYWQWSLNKGIRWVPLSMVLDVMKAVSETERQHHGQGFPVKVDDRIGSKIQSLPIEELTLDDPGDQAIQRALSYLPEAGVYVDYDGTVTVYSRASGGEKEIVQALQPELFGEGHSDLVENSLIRPKEIHVLFTREVELRFDFVENATASSTRADLGDARLMENVLPVPDYQLTVGGRTIPQDTWITTDEAFVAWGNLPLVGITRRLDHDLVQRAFVPHMDLWAALQIAGDQPSANGTLVNWIGRLAAVQVHYRRSFRVNPKWTDRMLSMRAYRLATIDPQSGQRGPASVYGDYCIMYTQRSIWRNIAQNRPLDYCINRTAYPSSGNLDSTAVTSPAILTIPDPDQGIIHVDYVIDPNRVYEMILPSQMQLDSMPTANIVQRERPISFDTVLAGGNPPRLSPAFKLAVVISAVPASPNTTQQLHRIVVKPSDVRSLLPEGQHAGLTNAKGPIMEVRIGAQVEVARIQWKDDRSKEIEKIFGITEGEPNLTDLVLNEDTNADRSTGASLNAIAKARAAAIYGSLVDRFEGATTGYMNGGVKLAGYASEIVHQLSPDGVATTAVSLPPEVPQISLFSFLSSSDRAAILKLVQP